MLEKIVAFLIEETSRSNAIFLILDEIIFESKKLRKNFNVGSTESINMMYSQLMNHYDVKVHARAIFKQMLNKVVRKGLLKQPEHIRSLKKLYISKRNGNFAKAFFKINLWCKAFCGLKKITNYKRQKITYAKKICHYNAILKHTISRQKFGQLNKDYQSVLAAMGITKLNAHGRTLENSDFRINDIKNRMEGKEGQIDESISDGPDSDFFELTPLGARVEDNKNLEMYQKEKLALDFYAHTLVMKFFVSLKMNLIETQRLSDTVIQYQNEVKRNIYLRPLFFHLQTVPYLMERGLEI